MLLDTLLILSNVRATRDHRTIGTASGGTLECASDIQSKAITVAQQIGLQGMPTSVECKDMSYGEFSARTGQLYDHDGVFKPDERVTLVVLDGDVVVRGQPPVGTSPLEPKYNNAYVLFDSSGMDIASGAMASGHEINLAAAVPTPLLKCPEPKGGEYQKCDSEGNCPVPTHLP